MPDSQTSGTESLFLIRVEGQNFKWVIDDTHDLSTIAGGSRLLAGVPEQVKATLDDCVSAGKLRAVETIQRAASIGLFAVCPGSADMDEIVVAVKEALSKGDFSHLTVSVEWTGTAVPSKEEWKPTIPPEALKQIGANLVDRLMAAARFTQVRALNVAVPKMVMGSEKSCCEDHVRPATNNSELGRSASVYARRKKGKEFRWTNNGIKTITEGVRTFDEMTERKDEPRLHGKIAVISIDGCGFSGIREKFCQNAAGMKQFSEALVQEQQTFLDSLLAEWARTEADPRPDPRYFCKYTPSKNDQEDGRKGGNLLRFQRLVTAGDDSIYLMPAWLAWEFLERFFNHHWTLKLTGSDDVEKLVPLTFRAGVVICNAKAPIHPIRDLAGKLESEIAREAAKSGIANPVAYEILKSFDLIGSRLDEYRKERRSMKLTAGQMVLEGTKMSAKKENLLKMNKEHPSAEIENWQRWPEKQEADAYHLSQWRDYIL